MTPIFVDTHVIVWLRQNKLHNFSKTALQQLKKAEVLYYSPMVKLELAYLEEIGRLKLSPDAMLGNDMITLNIKMSNTPLASICAVAESIGWVRDVFDRLIVGEVMATKGKLITADTTIQLHFKSVLW